MHVSDSVHLHEEASLLCTGHMEGGVAVGLVALNAGPHPSLLTYIACQLPPGWWDCLYAVYWLQKHLYNTKNKSVNWYK